MQKLANHLFKTTCWLRGGFWFCPQGHMIWAWNLKLYNKRGYCCMQLRFIIPLYLHRTHLHLGNMVFAAIRQPIPGGSPYKHFFRQRHGNRKSIIVASVYGWRQFFDFMPDQKGKWGIQYCLARANTKWGAILHTVFCAEILQDRKCGMILLRL